MKQYLILKHSTIEEAQKELNQYANLFWEVKSFIYNEKKEIYVTLLEGDETSGHKKPDSQIATNVDTFGFNSYQQTMNVQPSFNNGVQINTNYQNQNNYTNQNTNNFGNSNNFNNGINF